MKYLKRLLPYTITMLFCFYILPMLIKDTGSAMLVLLIAMPFICLLGSGLHCAYYGFCILPSLITAVLFAPTIFIFYNASAWVYIAGYFIVSLIGSGGGHLIYCKRAKK